MFGLVLNCCVEAKAGALHDSESIETANSGHLEGIGEIEHRTGEVEKDVVFVKVSSDMNGPKGNKLFDAPDVLTGMMAVCRGSKHGWIHANCQVADPRAQTHPTDCARVGAGLSITYRYL